MNEERERDILKVKALPPFGGQCTVFWHDGGGGDVYRIWDMLFLFSIPQYGGDGSFEGAFSLGDVEKLVDLAHTWT